MRETQGTIEHWRGETFGGRPTPVNMAVRANEEMAELIRAVTTADEARLGQKIPDADRDAIAGEAADVLIVLYGVATMAGFDLHRAVDAKMAVNRSRVWTRDKAGRSHHIPDQQEGTS